MAERSTIKAVIFDLGNVLLHFDAVRSARCFSRKAKVPFDLVWKHFFTSQAEKAYTRGEMTTQKFFVHSKAIFNCNVSFKDFCFYWNDIFWENKGMRKILRTLSRNYPLYLISNTNELHFDHVQEKFPHLFKYFKKTFPSHTVGRRKPDRRIFWKALKTAGLRPAEAVFVDDIPKFVQAARKIGMPAVCFKSNPQLQREFRKLKVEGF